MPYKRALFIDQTALLAYLSHKSQEKYFEIANDLINSFFEGKYQEFDTLVTSDYVIMNVAETLFRDYENYSDVIQFIDNIIRSSSIKIINIHEDGFIQSCRKIKIYHDILQLDYSLTDAATLYILHSSRIKAILSFNPQIHRLEYLLSKFDFDPDMNSTNERLIYDAKPDIFKDEIKQNFLIKNVDVNPKNAISLFDLELSGWNIKDLEAQNGNITKLKLDYYYEKNLTYNKHQLPNSIINLVYLKYLDLSNNDIINLNDNILPFLSKISNLTMLNLEENGLTKENITNNFSELLKNNCEILI